MFFPNYIKTRFSCYIKRNRQSALASVVSAPVISMFYEMPKRKFVEKSN